jgi:YesN/AraC family two-component response regulator
VIKLHKNTDTPLIRFAITNIAQELLETQYKFYAEEQNGYLSILLNADGFEQQDSTFIHNSMTKLVYTMESCFKSILTIGIGTIKTAITDIPSGFEQAKLATRYAALYGKGSVILYSDIESRENKELTYPYDIENNMIANIKKCDKNAVANIFEEFINEISDSKIESINIAMMQLSFGIEKTLHMLDNSAEKYNKLTNHVIRCETLEEKRNVLYNSCCDYIANQEDFLKMKNNKLVVVAINYISENYSNPSFNIDDMAAYIGISQNSLRQVFREVKDASPLDYLINYRIEVAKKLLETTDFTAKKVSEMVGYTESRYFYSVFKKKVGVTTHEYRKKFNIEVVEE